MAAAESSPHRSRCVGRIAHSKGGTPHALRGATRLLRMSVLSKRLGKPPVHASGMELSSAFDEVTPLCKRAKKIPTAGRARSKYAHPRQAPSVVSWILARSRSSAPRPVQHPSHPPPARRPRGFASLRATLVEDIYGPRRGKHVTRGRRGRANCLARASARARPLGAGPRRLAPPARGLAALRGRSLSGRRPVASTSFSWPAPLRLLFARGLRIGGGHLLRCGPRAGSRSLTSGGAAAALLVGAAR